MIWQTKGRFMSLRIICIFSSASPWMCPGTVSTNSNTAGLCRDIHLPSLGMPKWLWRCNSLILSSEQCSSYCYGKSMWLSWMAASMGFCWEAKEHSSNLCRRHHQIKGKKNPKTHHTMLALLNYRVRGITEQERVRSAGEHLAKCVHENDRWHYCTLLQIVARNRSSARLHGHEWQVRAANNLIKQLATCIHITHILGAEVQWYSHWINITKKYFFPPPGKLWPAGILRMLLLSFSIII